MQVGENFWRRMEMRKRLFLSFEECLYERDQADSFDNTNSNFKSVVSVVPHGSVLEPLLI